MKSRADLPGTCVCRLVLVAATPVGPTVMKMPFSRVRARISSPLCCTMNNCAGSSVLAPVPDGERCADGASPSSTLRSAFAAELGSSQPVASSGVLVEHSAAAVRSPFGCCYGNDALTALPYARRPAPASARRPAVCLPAPGFSLEL